jgi:hypothetical protein
MEAEQQAPEPEYDSSGVDVTLIEWMAAMSPAERLETLQSFGNWLIKARGEDSDT